MTGATDYLIWRANSCYLHEHLPGPQYEVLRGFRHGLPVQDPLRFNALLDTCITRAKAKLAGMVG